MQDSNLRSSSTPDSALLSEMQTPAGNGRSRGSVDDATRQSLAAAAPSAAQCRACILIAVLLWSTGGLFAKAPVFAAWSDGVRGTVQAFWRALFAGLLILPGVRRPRWSGWLLPMGCCFAAMNILYLRSMAFTTAANAIWLQSTAPFWVALFVAAQTRSLPARREVLTLACGGFGVGCILWFELSNLTQAHANVGILCGLASAVAYGGVVLFMSGLRHLNSGWLAAVNLFVTSVAIFPWMWQLGIWPSATQMLVLAAWGFLQMGLPYFLFGHGLRGIPPQEAMLLGLLEPIVTPVWVALAWGEWPKWWTGLGAAAILLGLALRYTWRPPDRGGAVLVE